MTLLRIFAIVNIQRVNVIENYYQIEMKRKKIKTLAKILSSDDKLG